MRRNNSGSASIVNTVRYIAVNHKLKFSTAITCLFIALVVFVLTTIYEPPSLDFDEDGDVDVEDFVFKLDVDGNGTTSFVEFVGGVKVCITTFIVVQIFLYSFLHIIIMFLVDNTFDLFASFFIYFAAILCVVFIYLKWFEFKWLDQDKNGEYNQKDIQQLFDVDSSGSIEADEASASIVIIGLSFVCILVAVQIIFIVVFLWFLYWHAFFFIYFV